MRPIVLITTCLKNLNRVKAIENTVATVFKKNNVPYFYVTSDLIPSVPLLKISKFNECYEQLPLKTFFALKNIQDMEFTHVIKLDDDTYFDFKKLDKNVFKYDYIGKFNKIVNCNNIHYFKCKDEFKVLKEPAKSEYAEGGFYILSKKAVNEILSYKESYFLNTPSNYRGEDVIVGEILKDKNFKKLNLDDTKHSVKLNMDITKNGTSLHPIHFSLFKELFCKSKFLDKLHILEKNYAKNDYNKRDIYLKLYEKNSDTGAARR